MNIWASGCRSESGGTPLTKRRTSSLREQPSTTLDRPGAPQHQIQRAWVVASPHAGTEGVGYYWSKKLQEQPKSTQEWPGGAPGWIWASWPTWLRAEAPGAAKEHPGVARRSSWLDLGILANRAKGRSSRSSPRGPRGGQEKLLAGFGHPCQHG